MIITGNIIAQATILGITKKETGSKDKVSRASICSLTRIVPNSAAIVAPTLPVIPNPVIIGPNSNKTASPTIPPTYQVGISPDWEDGLNRWKIDININSKIHEDPNRYDNEVVYNKVNEYYKYYYDKYNKQ